MTSVGRDVFLAETLEWPVDEAEAKAARGFLAKHRVRVLRAESLAEVARELEKTGSEPEGVALIARKGLVWLVRVDDVSLKAAPLLKQELLAVGGDAAQARGIADHSVDRSVVVLAATAGEYQRVVAKLDRQPFHLGDLGRAVELAIRNHTHAAPRVIRGAHRDLTVGDRPKTMGVVNVTPDSFSDGGDYLAPDDAVARAEVLLREGADVIDIGAESTRPGATPTSPEVEWARLAPVLSALHDRVERPISVDTRHAEVARKAVDAGADWVNDVSGLRDAAMRRVVADTGAAAVVMHMRGDPGTMQSDTRYGDVRDEVFGWLADATATAMADGIGPDRLVIDPGLGFGKTAEQNFELLGHVGELRSLGFPVMVGASRKSFLGAASGSEGAKDRKDASVAAAVLAAMRGAEIVRVHDVRETVQALRVVDALRTAGRPTGSLSD
jgi:dihydropteroate synthase